MFELLRSKFLPAEKSAEELALEAYGLGEGLREEQVYTLELLIEWVRSKFEGYDFEGSGKRNGAREKPGYKPGFSGRLFRKAVPHLVKLDRLSLQKNRSLKRPIRDVTGFQYLTALKSVLLGDNELEEVGALGGCVNLRRLELQGNKIRDLSGLAGCLKLEELNICKNPVEDLSVLEGLSNLRELKISTEQVPLLKELKVLPALWMLEPGSDIFDSFEGFPEMPELREIRGAKLKCLAGLERFPKLKNLTNLGGEFDSLEPLRELRGLTHANILSSQVTSVEPLSRLVALRHFVLYTPSEAIDLAPLEGLPALHSVTVRRDKEDVPALAKLQEGLTSWDVEFQADVARHTPSLELEMVDESTFEHFNTKAKYGLREEDTNESLLDSERDWIGGKIEEIFAPDFKEDEDFWLPYQWTGARSTTVVLLSDRAVDAFGRLVLGIQEVLCHARYDWIVYFQSDVTPSSRKDFIVWVYPDKVMATEENAVLVRKLIRAR